MNLATVVAELKLRHGRNSIADYFTTAENRALYPKHMEFFEAGATNHQRLFRAANRVGKTTGAGIELVYHLTGEYPDWWVGKRFDGANLWWVCGKSAETIRQILQPLLLGPIGAFGTGLIPHAALDFDSLTDAKKGGTLISTFRVKHKSGAFSQVELKAYEQGRGAFEGTERSIWLDEEPPQDVYVECLTRTMTGDNLLMLTFTPLKGASEVIMSFSKDGVFEDGQVGESKWVTTATWWDVPHITPEMMQIMLASYPPYQRDARSKGVPSLGSGLIYPVPEEDYLVDPFELPPAWRRLYGLDVGNNTAAVWLAINPDTGEGYVYSSYLKQREEPSIHAEGVKSRGEWIPGVIDPASRGRSQSDGQRLMEMYLARGLHVTKAINAVETGLYDVWDALVTGKLKIFRGQEVLMKEIRQYARDEKGHVVKANDHCFSGDTLVWTDKGQVPIMDLVGTEGKVISLGGKLEDYTNCHLVEKNAEVVEVKFDSCTITCTPDHLFMTTEGWVEAQHLAGHGVLNSVSQPPKVICKSSTSHLLFKNLMESATTRAALTSATIGLEAATASIELFGSTTMGRYLRAIRSTTSTKIREIINSLISSASHLLNTMPGIPTLTCDLHPLLSQPLLNGIGHLKVGSGTAQSILVSRSRNTPTPVSNAVLSFSQHTTSQAAVINHVEHGKIEVCLGVQPASNPIQDVYCLDVPTTHAFCVGSGLTVHNCMDAMRYAWMTRDKAKNKLEATGRGGGSTGRPGPVAW